MMNKKITNNQYLIFNNQLKRKKKRKMMMNSENQNGLKGQYNLARGIALGWETIDE